MLRTFFGLGLLAGLTLTGTVAAGADTPKARVLMLTQSKGFTHGSVRRPEKDKLSVAEVAMTQLGQQTGLFDVVCSQDAAADFTKDNLQKFDMVVFYTTGFLPISQADRDYFFKEWLPQKGHSFVGFHSATDTYHSDTDPAADYQPYWDMIGGSFNGHPWNAGNEVTISIHEPNHPAMKPFGEELKIKDEIYQYKHWQPNKVRVLMSLNMEKCEPKAPYMVPISWVKEYGEGRVFYTNLGHNEATWTNKAFLDHVTGGIRWCLHLEEADATPNPELSAKLEAKAKADFEKAGGKK